MTPKRFSLIRPRPSDSGDGHEQLFVQGYSTLLSVARRVAAGDRQATSRAASARALRFFHGFYPSEIARIASVSVPVVHVWLSKARAEARAALASAVIVVTGVMTELAHR